MYLGIKENKMTDKTINQKGKLMTSKEEYIEILTYWLRQSNSDGFNGFTIETEEYELFEKEAIDTLINFR